MAAVEQHPLNITVLSVTHMPYWMPADSVYLPIQAGRALHEGMGITGDDTGIEISGKNRSYCELTALYWAWKNLSFDALGLCHYRRYFGHRVLSRDPERLKAAVLSRGDYERLLDRADVILPARRHYWIETVGNHYIHSHGSEDLRQAKDVLRELQPSYLESFDRVLSRRSAYILNMFVMKQPLLEEYCTWLFGLLEQLEPRIDLHGRNTYDTRVFGFLSERLFNVWLEKRQPRCVEVPVVSLEPVDWPRKILGFLRHKFAGRS